MKHLLLFITAATLCCANVSALTRWAEVTCNQPEATIFVDGENRGHSPVKFLVTKNVKCTVRLVLPGFVTQTYFFYYESGKPAEKKKNFDLLPDPSWEASVKTELANIEIGLNTTKPESEAWKSIKRIVNSYFEIPEQVDDGAGYMRTAWVATNYDNVTIRTRVLIRAVSSEPLEYKVKIYSEYSDRVGAKANEDDRFKPWDRILRKYEQLIPELQTRLK